MKRINNAINSIEPNELKPRKDFLSSITHLFYTHLNTNSKVLIFYKLMKLPSQLNRMTSITSNNLYNNSSATLFFCLQMRNIFTKTLQIYGKILWTQIHWRGFH